MLGEKMEFCYMEADDNFRIATCRIMKKEWFALKRGCIRVCS